jgi:hypothetical protein
MFFGNFLFQPSPSAPALQNPAEPMAPSQRLPVLKISAYC